jgi:hypothetical protein
MSGYSAAVPRGSAQPTGWTNFELEHAVKKGKRVTHQHFDGFLKKD